MQSDPKDKSTYRRFFNLGKLDCQKGTSSGVELLKDLLLMDAYRDGWNHENRKKEQAVAEKSFN